MSETDNKNYVRVLEEFIKVANERIDNPIMLKSLVRMLKDIVQNKNEPELINNFIDIIDGNIYE
jgi:hypothetical protein